MNHQGFFQQITVYIITNQQNPALGVNSVNSVNSSVVECNPSKVVTRVRFPFDASPI
jgi:hypothetical protein